MKRLLLSLAAVTALLGSTLAGTALAQDIPSQNARGAAPAFKAQRDRNDPSGQDRRQGGDGQGWGSDRGQGWGSDRGQGWGSDRGRFDRMNLEGRWVADNHSANMEGRRGGRGVRGGMRAMLLPNFIFIDQKPNMLRVSDQDNHPLQTIMLGDKFDLRYGGDRPDYFIGRWDGSTLVVQHPMPKGAAITQSFELQNHGRSLVVTTTRREGFGSRTTEITTTYRRA
jgi:hypothetical protein